MTTTLATIRDQIETRLADEVNLIFRTQMLDEAIRAALAGLSDALGAVHTLADLDGALETTLEACDFPVLVAGGAAFALSFRVVGKSEEASPAVDRSEGLYRLANDWMNRYQALLIQLRLRTFHESADQPHSAWEWTEERGFS